MVASEDFLDKESRTFNIDTSTLMLSDIKRLILTRTVATPCTEL
jgi:hypothetical protein